MPAYLLFPMIRCKVDLPSMVSSMTRVREPQEWVCLLARLGILLCCQSCKRVSTDGCCTHSAMCRPTNNCSNRVLRPCPQPHLLFPSICFCSHRLVHY